MWQSNAYKGSISLAQESERTLRMRHLSDVRGNQKKLTKFNQMNAALCDFAFWDSLVAYSALHEPFNLEMNWGYAHSLEIVRQRRNRHQILRFLWLVLCDTHADRAWWIIHNDLLRDSCRRVHAQHHLVWLGLCQKWVNLSHIGGNQKKLTKLKQMNAALCDFAFGDSLVACSALDEPANSLLIVLYATYQSWS